MAQKPRKKKRIVSFDLDMTLLDHKTWKIPDSAMKALELLRKDSVIVSRKRQEHGPNDMSVVYRDMIMPDAVIHMNGTRVVAEGNVLFGHLMDKDRLRALLEYGDTHGISLGVSQEGKDYYIHPEGVVRMDRLRWGVSERNFMDGWELDGYAGEDIGVHRRSGRRQGAGGPFS
ncbi:MAG: HAD family hydrolase [Enterocloster clostridioformis]